MGLNQELGLDLKRVENFILPNLIQILSHLDIISSRFYLILSYLDFILSNLILSCPDFILFMGLELKKDL